MDLDGIREAVWRFTPTFKRILDEQGDLPLVDYYRASRPAPAAGLEVRREELVRAVHDLLAPAIGTEEAAAARDELRDTMFASTADHDGPPGHPMFSHGSVVQGFANRADGLRTTFVFPCAGVSLNNHSYARGVLFHTPDLAPRRAPFFSLRHRHAPVFAMPPYAAADVRRAANAVGFARARDLIKEVYGDPGVLALPSYADQLVRSSYLLWRRVPGMEGTRMVHLAQENVARALIRDVHLAGDTPITALMLDPVLHRLFERHFDGVPGAFSSASGKGTMLFWLIDGLERKPLTVRDGLLAARDGSWEMPLRADAMRDAVAAGTLMPGMTLSLMVLSFEHGLACGGGFSQVNYLGRMKDAYVALLREGGFPADAERALAVRTDVFRGEITLAYLDHAGKRAPADLIDLAVHGDPGANAALLERLAGQVTLREAADTMMPIFHQVAAGGPAIPDEQFFHAYPGIAV